MTPLSKAQELLDDVVSRAATAGIELPTNRYPQVGNTTMTCAGVYVTVLGADPQTLENSTAISIGSPLSLQNCGVIQLATFNIAIARECSNPAYDDGTDNPEAVAEISAELDADGQLLWDFATEYEAWNTKTYTLRWAIEGTIGYTSLSLTVGVD